MRIEINLQSLRLFYSIGGSKFLGEFKSKFCISDSIFIKHIVSLIIKCYSKTKGRIPTGIVVCVLNFGRRILL